MEKDGTDYVWLSMEHIPREQILKHFPNIYQHCLEEGYDVTKELSLIHILHTIIDPLAGGKIQLSSVSLDKIWLCHMDWSGNSSGSPD